MQVQKLDIDCSFKQGLRDRLNLIAAAQTHVAWKNRLAAHVHGISQEPLSAALPVQTCPLDNLIDGVEFSVFRELDAFRTLRAAHHTFHQLACVVVDKLSGDDPGGATLLFENEYSRAFYDIIASLSAINRELMD